MPLTKTILVVDDDLRILKAVGEALGQEGYHVITATDGEGALRECQRHTPDMIVLDIGLPGLDGFEVCGRIRSLGSQVPVLILSARGEETDKLVGFRMGADDYLTKPFSVSELIMRVRAILRRASGTTAAPKGGPSERVTCGPVEVDRSTHKAKVRGMPVELTPREFHMLWLFATHPNQVFSREQLLERVWQSTYEGDQASVTVYIRRLREKIERTPGEPEHLKTVWGIGYKFEP